MKKITLITFLLPFLFSCTPTLPDLSALKITAYQKHIHQGSVLEHSQVNQLKIGMTKTQVKDLIGSPSIIDPFHSNQWDYVNHSTLYKKDDIHYRLTLNFNDNILSKIITDGLDSLPKPSDKKAASKATPIITNP